MGVAREGSDGSYIWDDNHGNIRTLYYLDVDTRAMTLEERALFEELERKKKNRRHGGGDSTNDNDNRNN